MTNCLLSGTANVQFITTAAASCFCVLKLMRILAPVYFDLVNNSIHVAKQQFALCSVVKCVSLYYQLLAALWFSTFILHTNSSIWSVFSQQRDDEKRIRKKCEKLLWFINIIPYYLLFSYFSYSSHDVTLQIIKYLSQLQCINYIIGYSNTGNKWKIMMKHKTSKRTVPAVLMYFLFKYNSAVMFVISTVI